MKVSNSKILLVHFSFTDSFNVGSASHTAVYFEQGLIFEWYIHMTGTKQIRNKNNNRKWYLTGEIEIPQLKHREGEGKPREIQISSYTASYR